VLPTSSMTGATAANLISASEGFLIWHYLDTLDQIDVQTGRFSQ